MQGPHYDYERSARAAGARRVAGVDEAGRGPLAGPVVAAAVWIDDLRIPDGLDDSKKLPAQRREALFDIILGCCDVGVGVATLDEIDSLNILRASHLAMCRAVSALAEAPDHVLIDGNMIPETLTCRAECVVGGDALCLSVAAASIVAKVTRDRLMVDLAQQYPGYGWERNAGYPTPEHIAALEKLGPTPAHRRSFAPVHKILYQAKIISV